MVSLVKLDREKVVFSELSSAKFHITQAILHTMEP